MDRPFYEYVLKYPEGFFVDGVDVSGVVFYVGKGKVASRWQAYERIDQHEAEARGACECRKCCVIRGIWDKGMQVDKARIFESAREWEVLTREEQDIKVTYSSPYLTNFVYNRPKKVYQPVTAEQHRNRLLLQSMRYKPDRKRAKG